MFGRGWKMDHSPFMLASAGGTEGLRRHRTTSRRFDGTQRDRYAKGRMCCGMIVCRFQLADGNQGDGGLCVIPGSHKVYFPCPKNVLIYQRNRGPGYNIPGKAGAMVILTRRRSTEPSLAGRPPKALIAIWLLAQLSALCRRRLRNEHARPGTAVDTCPASCPGGAVYLQSPTDRGRQRNRHSPNAGKPGRYDPALKIRARL